MTTAEEFKAAGNAALKEKNYSLAIDNYTKAINADGANHVFYSNRSAAYLSKGDAHNALEDASACVALNPQFAKGYSRKGAALHSLKRYNDSMAAYNEGLEKFPADAGLKKGLEDAKREKENPFGSSTSAGGPGAGGGLFGPQMLAQMAMDPRMRTYLNDPDVMQKIQLVQQNPNLMPTIMKDPKMMELLGMMMGQEPGGAEPYAAAPTRPSAPAPKKEEQKPMEVEEDWSDLSPAELKKKEAQRDARLKKEEGNEFYKKKEFEKALESYDAAIEIDPTNMTFLSNKAAVYFTQKKYDECVEMCNQAVEVGKANMGPFEDRAKAYARCAKAYQKKGDLANAIEMCKAAQLEHFDKATQRMLKTMELDKKKKETLAYLDDAKAEESKQRGNDLFRAQKWAESVAEYEDAVKRAPKNAPIRNNLSAALCKIMDFNGAKREVEKALELDPKYVKAWSRKGDIEIVMKEFHKAMDSYQMGLDLDPSNATCKQGLSKVRQQINYGRQNMTDEQKKEQQAHAMADPQIQSILSDPVIQQVLRDFNENPSAAQQAMSDPLMRSKIERLIASGVIERG
jgi:stress-induced-phosphoprotein 1